MVLAGIYDSDEKDREEHREERNTLRDLQHRRVEALEELAHRLGTIECMLWTYV